MECKKTKIDSNRRHSVIINNCNFTIQNITFYSINVSLDIIYLIIYSLQY